MPDLRAMTPDDIPLGMRLKAQAGWNQTRADWEMLLAAGCGLVAAVNGQDVGTATVVPYGDAFAWIGMVLVDPAHRRRGVGTALLEAAVALAREHGAARLDATLQGKPLYTRLGFEDEAEIVRMVRAATRDVPVPLRGQGDVEPQPVTGGVLLELARYDAGVFGASRLAILSALLERAPAYAYYVRSGGVLAGCCLGRSGSAMEQIGPIVAEEMDVAQVLLRAALAKCKHRGVIVDVPFWGRAWLDRLVTLGFEPQRTFTRMYLGGEHSFGRRGAQYAMAGPEVG